jgi:hypothetical protein
MTPHDLRTLLTKLVTDTEAANAIAKTAEGGRQSLGGSGVYARKFHDAVVAITASENKVRPHLSGLGLIAADLDTFERNVAILKDTGQKMNARVPAARALRLVCETVIVPKAESMTASSVPTTEQVLPLDVVKGTRTFLEKIVTQANGCYEHQWYDACSVMIRKLAEILIIAVYDHKGAAAEIKEGDGFLQLSKLIGQIKTKQNVWHFGRDTCPCLDKMKEIGDRAAHTRNYVATKVDVDAVLNKGLRTTIEDLLNHTGWKK